jgi:GTP cyclohydrolase I
MEDLQSLADSRNVPIERVGITKLALPVQIREKDDGFQHVVAEASMFVDVPATVRGTHMSRFVEVLHEWANRPVSSRDIESLLLVTRERAGSLSAEVGLTFRYFIRKTAPVSGRIGAVDYQCSFRGRMDEGGYRFALRVGVPVTTLCPCSKAISDYGAHNQRTVVEVEVESRAETIVWIEDVVSLVEEQASCPVFAVLKREDEKWVTERAYENPKFVEDVVRDVLLRLSEHPGVEHLSVTSESIESIHNHNAYAAASIDKVSRRDMEVRQSRAVLRLATVDVR